MKEGGITKKKHDVFCKKDHENALQTFLAEKRTHSTHVDIIFILCFKPEKSPDWSKKKKYNGKVTCHTHSSLQPDHFSY